jgi:type III pantothenate kinase
MIDSVVDGRTGVHVPPRDPERLAEAISSLLADGTRCRAYGTAGVKRARRLYDWRRVAAQAIDVYEQVAAAAARDRRISSRSQAESNGSAHLTALADAVAVLRSEHERIDSWGEWLGEQLLQGGRLLAVGNGGSAAEAEHLTAELVGRFETERRPLGAIPLHADGSALTAIGNDYGGEQCFARQVEAHGRPGDVLVALSTSGRSVNVLRAVESGNRLGLVTWGLTGSAPNPLAEICDEAVICEAPSAATVQEMHLVAVHLLCGAVDRSIARLERDDAARDRRDSVAELRALEPSRSGALR